MQRTHYHRLTEAGTLTRPVYKRAGNSNRYQVAYDARFPNKPDAEPKTKTENFFRPCDARAFARSFARGMIKNHAKGFVEIRTQEWETDLLGEGTWQTDFNRVEVVYRRDSL